MSSSHPPYVGAEVSISMCKVFGLSIVAHNASVALRLHLNPCGGHLHAGPQHHAPPPTLLHDRTEGHISKSVTTFLDGSTSTTVTDTITGITMTATGSAPDPTLQRQPASVTEAAGGAGAGAEASGADDGGAAGEAGATEKGVRKPLLVLPPPPPPPLSNGDQHVHQGGTAGKGGRKSLPVLPPPPPPPLSEDDVPQHAHQGGTTLPGGTPSVSGGTPAVSVLGHDAAAAGFTVTASSKGSVTTITKTFPDGSTLSTSTDIRTGETTREFGSAPIVVLHGPGGEQHTEAALVDEKVASSPPPPPPPPEKGNSPVLKHQPLRGKGTLVAQHQAALKHEARNGARRRGLMMQQK